MPIYLGEGEVDDLDVAFGVLVREADPKQDAQGSAERVARHEELGVFLALVLEHLFDLHAVGEKLVSVGAKVRVTELGLEG